MNLFKLSIYFMIEILFWVSKICVLVCYFASLAILTNEKFHDKRFTMFDFY